MPLARIQADVAALAHQVTRYKNLDTGEITIELTELGLTLDQQSFEALFDLESEPAQKKLKADAKEYLERSGPLAPHIKAEIGKPKPAAAPPVKRNSPGTTQGTMLEILREFGPLTRTELFARCEKVGIAKSTANSTLYKMQGDGKVEQFDDPSAGGLTKWRVK